MLWRSKVALTEASDRVNWRISGSNPIPGSEKKIMKKAKCPQEMSYLSQSRQSQETRLLKLFFFLSEAGNMSTSEVHAMGYCYVKAITSRKLVRDVQLKT